ncbi:MAG: hypothetical protein ACT4OM_13540 [Actinomycetota bacterium]
MTEFTTQIWYSDGTSYTWPEQLAGLQPNVGMCFSGGGTRALVANMGQLPALLSFNFMDKRRLHLVRVWWLVGGDSVHPLRARHQLYE